MTGNMSRIVMVSVVKARSCPCPLSVTILPEVCSVITPIKTASMLGSALTSPVPKPVSPCLVTCAAVWTGVGQISRSADLNSDAMRHVIPLIVIKMAQNSASTPVLHPAIIIVIMKTRMFPGNSTVLIEQTKFKTHHWTL